MKKHGSFVLIVANLFVLLLCACSAAAPKPVPTYPMVSQKVTRFAPLPTNVTPSLTPSVTATPTPTPFKPAKALPVYSTSKLKSPLPVLTVWPLVQVPDFPAIERKPGQKIAYLTFDDGPTRKALKPTSGTENLLAILERRQVRATFFMIGANVLANPDLARRIVADGNAVGNHTWSHINFNKVKGSAFDREVTFTKTAIQDITGISTSLLRPPGGFLPDSKQMDFLRSQQMEVFFWNVDTRDWAGSSDESILATIRQGIHDHKDLVILFHDCAFGALDQAIDLLQANNYQFDTLDHFTDFKMPLAQK